MNINLIVNGTTHALDIAPGERLLDTLRQLGYTSVKFGCGEGTCGSCTVLLDGDVRLACITFTAQVAGRQITTAEGLGGHGHLHPLQQAFLDEGAVQCGYCTPGMLLAAKALLDGTPAPTDAEITRALDGNRCRCTGYVAILNAVRRAAKLSTQRHQGTKSQRPST